MILFEGGWGLHVRPWEIAEFSSDMNSLQNKFDSVATWITGILDTLENTDERMTAIEMKPETFSLPSFHPPPSSYSEAIQVDGTAQFSPN